MAYDYDVNRDLRRLYPLLVANLVAATLVAAVDVATGQPCTSIRGDAVSCSTNDISMTFVGAWFGVLIIQSVAQLGFLLLTVGVQFIPLPLRLPVLLGSSAGVGAALLWDKSVFVGAVAGLVLLTGWLYAIRDRIE